MLYLRPTFAAAIAIAVIASLQMTAVTFYNLADSHNLNQNNSYEYYTIR